ncbi:unnamed protein product [Brachionus calyciflorus]|uniref:UV-stimulated scaffold protein A C-terminal domain-containing protein n=1 Tax=Brachionus calyciflorus TaxID=104777 RepID=A0A814IZL8_9BILA|nr:unnamed protein product [Brachionus calyciflorus]
MSDFESRENLESLIIDLCKSGLAPLEEDKLKKIKAFCKTSEENLKLSYEILNTQIKKEHSEIRYAALQIIDCLFQRSHSFRELLLDDFQVFFELVLETNTDEPLPPPKKAAIELKKLAAKTIKVWNEKFGNEYKRLELGFNYLKNCKKIDFVSFSHQNIAQRVHTQKQNEKQQIFLNRKFTEYVQEMNDLEVDIKNCVKQLEQSINILVPHENLFNNEDFNITESKRTPVSRNIQEEISDFEDSDSDDDFVEVPVKRSKEEEVEHTNLELKYLGFFNGTSSTIEELKNTNIKIDLFLNENDENKVVIDIMKDLSKELKNLYLVKINKWIKNFTQIRQASENLKKAIEIKNMVQAVLKKIDNLNIKNEENEQKKITTPILSLPLKNSEGTSKNTNQNFENLDEKERKRLEMLKIAPVINLEEMGYLNPLVSKVEAQNPLFQRRDTEVTHDLIENAHRLTKKTFVGTFEPVKWSCRAPLKNGKLCPRMDRFKCPLHGKIVARDEMGNIVNEIDRIELEKNKKEVKPWEDAELLADINAATGLNLEPSDKKKAKKRKSGNLTELNKQETTRERLERRLLDVKSLRRIGAVLDAIERKQNYEKFHHNYNYALQS